MFLIRLMHLSSVKSEKKSEKKINDTLKNENSIDEDKQNRGLTSKNY